jgi:thioredoxin 1
LEYIYKSKIIIIKIKLIKMALNVTESNITDVLTEGVTVLDFFAEWCGPCRLLGPIIDELAEDNKDTVKIGKINVDSNQELAVKYGIRNIPTIIFLKDGEVKEKISGIQTKAVLQDKINLLTS